MENKKKYIIFIIMIQVILVICPGYSQDQDKGVTPEASQSNMFARMEQALKEQTDQIDQGIQKRVQKRSDARAAQYKAEELEKTINSFTGPLDAIATTAGIVSTAIGDPHAKMAAAALRISVIAIQGLGIGIATIVSGVSRYQERSLDILSITEALVEDIQRSIDKIKLLKEKQKDLLDVGKTPDPSKSSSRLKQFAQSLQSKVRQATDILTDEKVARQEKLKAIQIALKEENENFSEIVKLLQIKLLQDAVKEIDKKINVTSTIAKLTDDGKFYEVARKEALQSGLQGKKQLAEIEQKASSASKDLAFYMNFQKSPGEDTPEKLKEKKSSIIDKIKKLTQFTKLADSLYLQEKGIDPDAQLDKATIVALYKEIDNLKLQLYGYDLLLASDLPQNSIPERGKIYLNKGANNSLEYTVLNPGNRVAKNKIHIIINEELTPKILNAYKIKILEEISAIGDIQYSAIDNLKGEINNLKTQINGVARGSTNLNALPSRSLPLPSPRMPNNILNGQGNLRNSIMK